MAVRFYLVPKIGSGTALDPFRAKYVTDFIPPVRNSGLDYGIFEPTFFVGADVTAGQHAGVIANSDVTAIPLNLDSQIGANLAAVQAALEGLKIPAHWVTAADTYRHVIAITLKIFRYVQRFTAQQVHNFWGQGYTLDTTFSALTQAQRNALQAAADSFGIDTSSITGSSTIRQGLVIIAQQLPASVCMGETF